MTLYGLLSAIIDKVNKSIKTDSQNLSDTEKAQARANIDAAKSDILICNPNLLDNWYFKKPINQQKVESWSLGYGIDRWNVSTGATATITSDGLIFTGAAQYQNLEQSIIAFKELRGQTVTLTVLFNSPVENATFTTGFLFGDGAFYQEFISGSIYSCTQVVPTSASKLTIFIQDTVGNKSCNILAMKLEIGDTQTLAHQDSNGNWVLNEIPKYSEELLKCRQYDPYTGEYIGLRKFSQPRNLLDNSDFRKPVNQRNFVSGNSVGHGEYPIDRWFCYDHAGSGEVLNVYLDNQGITFKSPEAATITQIFPDMSKYMGKPLTLAIGLGNGTILVASDIVPTTEWVEFSRIETDNIYTRVQIFDNDRGAVHIRAYTDITIAWVALYEGEYTAETLPEYQPKGYATELAECQRYFQRFENSHGSSNFMLASGQAATSTRASFAVYFPVSMRIYPTITVSDVSSIILSNDGQQTVFTATSVNSAGGLGPNGQDFSQRSFSVVTSGLTAKSGYIVYIKSGGYIDFSADL